MELLKNLHGREVDSLCRRFGVNKAHTKAEFSQLLRTVPMRGRADRHLADEEIDELFLEIDMKRAGKVTWDMFTMHVIDVEMASSKEVRQDAVRKHVLDSVFYDELPLSIKRLDYFPSIDRVVKHVHRGRQSIIKLCDPTDMSVRCVTRALGAPSMCAEIIPGSVSYDSIVVGCRDMTVSFWEYRRSSRLHRTYTHQLEETQLCFHYVDKFSKLLSGSRSGTLSVWLTGDNARPLIQDADRIHHQAVTDIIAHENDVYTSSLDCSIKCTDVERGQVKMQLVGHEQGVCKLAHVGDMGLLASAGFELTPYMWNLGKRDGAPTKLEDKQRPHRSHLAGLEAVEGTPRLISADTCGLVKVWDVRMLRCVQSFLAEPASQHLGGANANPGQSKITALCSMDPHLKLAVGGKALSVFRYDQTSQPHLADDKHITIALYNAPQPSYLTAHSTSVKIWDPAGVPLKMGEDLMDAEIVAACMDPVGRRFFIAGIDGVVRGYSWSSLVKFLEIKIDGEPMALQWNEGGVAGGGEVVVFTTQGALWIIPGSSEDRSRDKPVCLKCLAWAQAKGVAPVDAAPSCVAVAGPLVIMGMQNGQVLLADAVQTSFIGVCAVTKGTVACVRTLPGWAAVVIADSEGGLTLASTRLHQRIDPVPLARWQVASPKALARVFGKTIPEDIVVMSVEALGSPSQCRIMAPATTTVNQVLADAAAQAPQVSCVDYDPLTSELYCGEVGGWVVVYNIAKWLTVDDEESPLGMGSTLRRQHTSFFAKRKRSSVRERLGGDDEVPVVRLWLAHAQEVTSLTFIAAKSRVLTAGFDAQVLLWTADGICIASLQQGGGTSLQSCQIRPSVVERSRLASPEMLPKVLQQLQATSPIHTPSPHLPHVPDGGSPQATPATALSGDASRLPPMSGSSPAITPGAQELSNTASSTFITGLDGDVSMRMPTARRETTMSLCASTIDPDFIKKPQRRTARMAVRSAPSLQQLAPTTSLSSPRARFLEIVPTQPAGTKPKRSGRKYRHR